MLQNELKGKSDKIALIAFDLLYFNGYDPRELPLVERKAHLKKPIAGTAIQFSECFAITEFLCGNPPQSGKARLPNNLFYRNEAVEGALGEATSWRSTCA